MGNLVTVTTYSERLHVPLRWWVQGIMFLATLWLALIVAVPEAWAWSIAGAILGLIALAYLAYGSAQISVRDGELHAGSARIEARWLGAVEPLDEAAARRVAGQDADARAYLLLRPYLKRAVRIRIDDPADPAPYWLISTRRPDALAAAVRSLTETSSGR
jgi:energy-coupling factor transporter transmembrane protein EcfT